jgi:hypothetical protein
MADDPLEFLHSTPRFKPPKKPVNSAGIFAVVIGVGGVLLGAGLVALIVANRKDEPVKPAALPIRQVAEPVKAAVKPEVDEWKHGPKSYSEALQTLKTEAEIFAGLESSYHEHIERAERFEKELSRMRSSGLTPSHPGYIKVEAFARADREQAADLWRTMQAQESKVERARQRRDALDR